MDPTPAMPETQDDDLLRRSLERHASLLPPVPSLVLQIQEQIASPWIDLRHLTRLVRTDPNVAGPVLRLANSVFHRGVQEIVDLEEAIQRIGVEQLRMVALALGSPIPAARSARFGFDARMYRFHALLVATVATRLGRDAGCGPRSLERLWTAGLLHDQGVLLLPILEPESWEAFLAAGPAAEPGEGADFLAVEREHLPWDHTQVGAAFLERKWSIPEEIVGLVRHWPNPADAGADAFLADCVRRADIAARAAGKCWQPAWSRPSAQDDPDECRSLVEECLPLVSALLPPE